MYRNDLYSNTSDSSRNGGGSWTYINGELYHYGRPGMEWGKHLPGTTWWKEQVGKIKSHYQTGYSQRGGNSVYNLGPTNPSTGKNYNTSTPGFRTKARAAIGAGISTAKYIGRGVSKYAKRLPGHLKTEVTNIGRNIKADIDDARAKYSKKISRDLLPSLAKFFDKNYKNNKSNPISGNTKLEALLKKEFGEAQESYFNAAKMGTAGQTINSFIQNAQYSVLNGVNGFLKSLKIDDDVDRFLNKFSRNK